MSSLIIRFANDILIKVGMPGFIDYLMLFELEFQLGQTKVMGWHIRFAAFQGTGVSDRGDSIHRPFWSAFLYNLLNSYSMFLFSIHRRSISRS